MPFGTDLLFEAASTSPTWWWASSSARTSGSPVPPSTFAAMAGATVIANLSGSNLTIGKAGYRRQLLLGALGADPRRVRVRGRR